MTAPNWTTEEQLRALMRLPWSILVEKDQHDGSFAAQVREIPDAIATGDTMRELGRDLWESLWASLDIRLKHNDVIPLPEGSRLPWDGEPPPSLAHRELEITQHGHVIVRRMAAA
jgi:predicted RNase H-like HicB family nuclease